MAPTASAPSTITPGGSVFPGEESDGVDLAASDDPRLLIPGDPVGLRAVARALVDNAGLHDATAVRQRHLHDGGWTGAAADAFHTHLSRQAGRHTATADTTRSAAHALTELADGIDEARTHAGRAAALHADSDPDQRGSQRGDPVLREQARDMLTDTRARLADVHARVRAQLIAAQARLPEPHRLLADPEPTTGRPPATLPALPRTADTAVYPAAATVIEPAAASPSRPLDTGYIADSYIADSRSASAFTEPPQTWSAAATGHRGGRRIVVQDGDTLSSIAARYLGDSTRWPEILDDNPTLAHPWEIYPGQTLTLPDDTPSHAQPTHHPEDPLGGPHESNAPDADTPDAGPTSNHPTAGPHPDTVGDGGDNGGSGDAGGVGLDEGLLIGGGLAAALSVAYLLRQRRRSRTYRPSADDTDRTDYFDTPDSVGRIGFEARWSGAGDATTDGRDIAHFTRTALGPRTSDSAWPRTRHSEATRTWPNTVEPPVAPVVRRLHFAYHSTPRPSEPVPGAVTGWAGPPLAPSPQPARAQARPRTQQPVSQPLVVPLGLITSGAGVYADLTRAPALALTNLIDSATDSPAEPDRDRAEDVARALLLTIAAGLRTPAGHPLGHVMITRADLRRLLDLTDAFPRTVALPGTIRVVENLNAALDELEVTLAHRAPTPVLNTVPESALVLIATAPRPGTPTRRMQQLLAAGHLHRVCAILLGSWPTAARITVAPDATAAAVTGPLPPDLPGARMFTVPRHGALDLLAALARPTDLPHTVIPYVDRADPSDREDCGVNAEVGSEGHPSRAAQPDSTAVEAKAPDAKAPDEVAAATVDAVDHAEATTPTSAAEAMRLQVFGRVTLHDDSGRSKPTQQEPASSTEVAQPTVSDQLSRRSRELLVYLALHPGGVCDDTVAEHFGLSAGTDCPPELADTAITGLRAELNTLYGQQMQHLIRTDGDGHHRLNPDLITIDYRDFTTAVHAARVATTADQRVTAHRATLDHYRGELAPDVHSEWIEAPRRHATCAAITAALDLARHLTANNDHRRAAAILEHAIAVIDPYSEALYGQLIRIHHELGRPDLAVRAFAALVTELAKIETTPSPDITALL